MVRHPPGARQVALKSRPSAIGCRITMQHKARDFTPVGTFRIGIKQSQIGDEVFLIVARQYGTGGRDIGLFQAAREAMSSTSFEPVDDGRSGRIRSCARDFRARRCRIRIDFEGDRDQRQNKNDDQGSHGSAFSGAMRQDRPKKPAKNRCFIAGTCKTRRREPAGSMRISAFSQLLDFPRTFCPDFPFLRSSPWHPR